MNRAADSIERSIEERLRALFDLQMVDSEIDKIRNLRGGLPLEVQDLEDEIVGIETRVQNHEREVKDLQVAISNKKNLIKEAKDKISKYEAQQSKVRNNRQYDSLNKEIEYQGLEIELAEKHIKQFTVQITNKKLQIENTQKVLDERTKDLEHKQKELQAITVDTQKDEDVLLKKSNEIAEGVEKRLLTAYRRIRGNAKNGLAVVGVERDACAGCFNKIPPQRQLDIRSRKKIIVCEHCGRILVDPDINNDEEENME